MKLKIAIVVHGRFHAFDLVRGLLDRGHDVTLLTNYPQWVVKRFGIAPAHVRSFVLQGMSTRVALRLGNSSFKTLEPWLHVSFGRWAAQQLTKEKWDMVIGWSGVSEELLTALQGTGTIRALKRGSSHICIQDRLLQEEAGRVGIPLERPNDWMIQRELREYALADQIIVLSTFSYNSFIDERVSPKMVTVLLPGVNTSHFQATQEIIEERCQRILAGNALRILNVGTFSYRKGIFDLNHIIQQLHKDNFEFRFVGPVPGEAKALAEQLQPIASFMPKQPQQNLLAHYNWGDIFVLPSIEDGFQTVLAQASAARLPIITTPNGAGLDLIQENSNGWIVPIRNSEAIIERLRWCNSHRKEFVEMLRHNFNHYQPRTWLDVANDLEQNSLRFLRNIKSLDSMANTL
ncbi:MAG: glycosyltransferase family 4 protein [Caldilineaceae bacterium]